MRNCWLWITLNNLLLNYYICTEDNTIFIVHMCVWAFLNGCFNRSNMLHEWYIWACKEKDDAYSETCTHKHVHTSMHTQCVNTQACTHNACMCMWIFPTQTWSLWPSSRDYIQSGNRSAWTECKGGLLTCLKSPMMFCLMQVSNIYHFTTFIGIYLKTHILRMNIHNCSHYGLGLHNAKQLWDWVAKRGVLRPVRQNWLYNRCRQRMSSGGGVLSPRGQRRSRSRWFQTPSSQVSVLCLWPYNSSSDQSAPCVICVRWWTHGSSNHMPVMILI
jgi:hypothetical protein